VSGFTFTFFVYYVLQVVSGDVTGSFIVQWGLRCWPEDGKYKCLELATSAESHKIDVFLSQMGSSNGCELKLR